MWLWFWICKFQIQLVLGWYLQDQSKNYPGMPDDLIDGKSTLVQLRLDAVGQQASWRQPLRVDGPKASQRSIITYEIHFCTDQAKTYREVRFWFDLSHDATRVHRQMMRITFCCFLFVFCRKVLPWDHNCLQNGGNQNTWHLAYGVLWRRHNMRT